MELLEMVNFKKTPHFWFAIYRGKAYAGHKIPLEITSVLSNFEQSVEANFLFHNMVFSFYYFLNFFFNKSNQPKSPNISKAW